MYIEYFGLKMKPFTITPDPRFLYMSQVHKEALAHLVYGIKEKSGFVVITGEAGTGKTTLLNELLQKLPPIMPKVVIKNPNVKQENIYYLLGEAIGIPEEKRNRNHINFYEERLKEIGGAALIVDEAQGLSIEMLEEIRLLSNLETTYEKLVHILLLGQQELNATLRSPQLRQLKQRISVKFHMTPLTQEETAEYIDHRLRVAGYEPTETPLFSKSAMKEVHKYTHGYPRLINILCDNSMLAAYTEDIKEVPPKLIRKVAQEIEGSYQRSSVGESSWNKIGLTIIVAALVACAAIFAYLNFSHDSNSPTHEKMSAKQSDEPSSAAPASDEEPLPPIATSLPPGQAQSKQSPPAQAQVKAGDTLASIALRYYGTINPATIKAILEANPQLNNTPEIPSDGIIQLPSFEKNVSTIYTVNVAWYHTQTEANAVYADLKNAGYDPFIYSFPDARNETWYVISLGSLDTRDQAAERAQELVSKGFLYARAAKISMEE